tara:strand:- start:316 stop:3006 length:2691 start_codon:yes stop_codon:yes gene_type:complete
MVTWWNNLFNKTNEEKQYEANSTIPLGFGNNAYEEPDANYYAFAKQGYEKDQLVYACIRELSLAASEPRYFIEAYNRDNERYEVTGGRYVDLLRKPNPNQDFYALLDQMVIHLHVTGNAYVYKERSQSGKVVAIYLLRPDRITIKSDIKEGVESYEYDIEGYTYSIPPVDVAHMKLVNPTNDVYGLSPLQVIAPVINLDLSIIQYAKAFFQNAGVPSGMLKIKRRINNQAEASDIRRTWRSQFSSPGNFHNLAILDEDASYEPLATPITDLALGDLRDTVETRICMAFGVPSILVGAVIGLDRATYANYKEARKTFYSEKMIPLVNRIVRFLNLHMEGEFPGEFIAVDFRNVRSLIDDKDDITKRAVDQYGAGLVTLNEARAVLGLDPVENGGVRRMPLNVLEVGGVVEETAKMLLQAETKELDVKIDNVRASRLNNQLVTDRERHAQLFEPQIIRFYKRIKESVNGVLGKYWEEQLHTSADNTKVYPFNAGIILPEGVENELKEIIQQGYMGIVKSTWEIIRQSGLSGDFNAEDYPQALANIYNLSGLAAKEIHGTTIKAVTKAIDIGVSRNYSVKQLAQGVPDDNFPGISSIISEAYRNRSQRIAITEMMRAQNATTMTYYQQAGVKFVQAYDPSSPNDTYIPPGDPYGRTCEERNLQIYRLNDARFIMDHPNGKLTWTPMPSNYIPEALTDPPQITKAKMSNYVDIPVSAVKALPDFKPTAGMATEAEKGLKWRKEFGRGGTQVGVTRANQLVARENLSADTVTRMHSYFSRHEVDKEAEGFRPGEKGYPSAGRIAWALWGGDQGQTWARKQRAVIERESEKIQNTKALPDNYRPADGEEECNNCGFYQALPEVSGGYCERWDASVQDNYVCNAWKSAETYSEDIVTVREQLL